MASCRVLCAVLPLLLFSGCCSLSRLFCGPDDSRWVGISYETPAATVATLLEAIRRDRPQIVHSCFSAEFCRQNKLDSVTAQIAWQRVKAQIPGIHLAGYAEIPEPQTLSQGHATLVIDVEGNKLQIDLVRESFRQVVFRRPDGSIGESRVPLPSWHGAATVAPIDDPDFDKSRLVFEPLTFEHEGLQKVPLATIQRAGLIRQWKVSALRTLE